MVGMVGAGCLCTTEQAGAGRQEKLSVNSDDDEKDTPFVSHYLLPPGHFPTHTPLPSTKERKHVPLKPSPGGGKGTRGREIAQGMTWRREGGWCVWLFGAFNSRKRTLYLSLL